MSRGEIYAKKISGTNIAYIKFFRDMHCEGLARAYNGGLGARPPVGVQGRSPLVGSSPGANVRNLFLRITELASVMRTHMTGLKF